MSPLSSRAEYRSEDRTSVTGVTRWWSAEGISQRNRGRRVVGGAASAQTLSRQKTSQPDGRMRPSLRVHLSGWVRLFFRGLAEVGRGKYSRLISRLRLLECPLPADNARRRLAP